MASRMVIRTAAVVALVITCAAAASAQPSPSQPASQPWPPERPRVALEIERGGIRWGEIVVELDPHRAPITVANFLRYTDEKYFDGTIIHRVLVGENARINVFQGGGYAGLNQPSKPGQHEPIKLESSNGLRNARGTIAMARDAAPDTATSEYFVNIEDNYKLDYVGPEKPGYCVFGRIVDGMDIVDRIARIETRTNPDPELKGERSQPVEAPVVRRARRVGSASEWWFPWEIGAVGEQRFRVSVKDTFTRDGAAGTSTDEVEFAVQINARPDSRPGVVVRLDPPKGGWTEEEEARRDRSEVVRWINGWAVLNPDGLTVTPDAVVVRDGELLRGPWRVGQRSTMLGFAAFFSFIPMGYSQVIGHLDYSVRSAEANRVTLELRFWLGSAGPELTGDGEVAFIKDAKGLVEAVAKWKRTHKNERHDVEMTVRRL